MKKLSIKVKMCLWSTLISALLMGGAMGAILHATNAVLLRDAWAKVEDLSRDASDEAEIEDGLLEVDDDIEFYRDGVTIAVYWPDGKLAAGKLPLSFSKAVPVIPGEKNRIVSQESGRWIVFDAPGEDGLVIRAVMSLNEMDHLMRSISLSSLFVYATIVLLSGLGSYRIAVGAFKPVSDIIAHAENIRSGNDLSKRISEPIAKDEIAYLTRTFNAMFERLEASFEKEKQFASDASHELRTPVSVITSECEYALRENDPESMRAALQASLEQTGRISKIVNNLLMLARAGNAEEVSAFEALDLGELAQLVADEFHDAAISKGIALEAQTGEGIEVYGDQTMLLRLIVNLVDNAIRYMDPDRAQKNVTIRVYSQNRHAMLAVADNGIGIPHDLLDKIWERFYRVNPRHTGEHQGVGLGLYIVQAIVKTHNGKIDVQSAPGKGSTFTVSLPRIERS